MANVFDVAAYILEKKGQLPTWKLQKLVYYSQAWSLVWDEEPLFPETIEAWINGPVCRALYKLHRGQYSVDRIEEGTAGVLTTDQRETVDAVLDFYGDKSPHWLSNLTHMETPWQDARKGLPPTERGDSEISHESMAEYYESIIPSSD